MSSQRRCLFCGTVEKMHHEHVLAAWIGEALPDLGKGEHRRTGPFGEDRGSWSDRAFSRKVGCTCEACNSGWMSDLEGTVKPLLDPILFGHSATFDASAQRALATWAFKTALVFAAQRDGAPASAYTNLYEQRCAPIDAKVWIGAFGAPLTTYQSHVPLSFGADASAAGRVNGFIGTFAFAHVAFHVFLKNGDDHSPHGFTKRLARAFTQIWPLHGAAVAWPPELTLGHGDLDRLTNAYGKVL